MKCKHCSKEIDNDSKFCEFCGTKVETETTRKKKKSWPIWLGVALGILAVIMAVSIRQPTSETRAENDKEMVILTINNYNKAITLNDFTTLSSVYADRVERYYSTYDQTNAEVIESCINYDSKLLLSAKYFLRKK